MWQQRVEEFVSGQVGPPPARVLEVVYLQIWQAYSFAVRKVPQKGKSSYTDGTTSYIKKTRPEACFPPPTPRAEFLSRHPTKNAEQPQPRANASRVPAP
jgi:hypothetical protein